MRDSAADGHKAIFRMTHLASVCWMPVVCKARELSVNKAYQVTQVSEQEKENDRTDNARGRLQMMVKAGLLK